LAAYDRGDYEAARLDFLQAQSIFPRRSSLRNLALSELHTNPPLDALRHLRTYIGDPGTTPDKRAIAERSLAEAYAQTGHLSITAPEGTQLKVDGSPVGVAPLKDPVDVSVGLHGVDADMKGTATHENVQAAAGKLTEVAFLAPVVGDTHVVSLGPPPPLAAVAPPSPPPVAPVPEKEGYWNSRRTVGVVIAGVGVVGLVIGGVFGAERGSETSTATSDLASAGASNPGVASRSVCTSPPMAAASACTGVTNALNSNGTDATIEETMAVSGGVLLAIGLVTTFWPGPAAPPLARLAPMTGPHFAGISWSQSF
jgi:hypothetical protein